MCTYEVKIYYTQSSWKNDRSMSVVGLWQAGVQCLCVQLNHDGDIINQMESRQENGGYIYMFDVEISTVGWLKF